MCRFVLKEIIIILPVLRTIQSFLMPLSVRQRTIHSRNGAKRSSLKGKRMSQGSEREFLTNASSDLDRIAYPGGALALILLLAARLMSAYFGHISDCDETFNYWEPFHYLVYGNGLQTWEYSPVYAIRSYMPLWLLAVPAKALALFMDPVQVFYTIRAILAALTALSEWMFYKAVCHEFGVHVGRLWLCLTLPAAGCFACCSAMLPSAWSSALVSAALACWWRRRYPAAIMFTAASTLLSWPFTALIGLPIAIDMIIIRRKHLMFLKWSIISLLGILLPTIAVDSWHYGRLVVAPWNIIAYNIFTEHGPDLYGVEPWTYYFVNGFLNFNVIWLLALSCPLLLIVSSAISARPAARASYRAPYWLGLMPLALWLAVFMLQSHKEERFLYPVYNMIVLAGAIGLDCLQKMTFVFRWKKETEKLPYLVRSGTCMVMCVFLTGIISLSRIGALYNNYQGSMTVLNDLPTATNSTEELYVCFGKDWYRSPSSFHLSTVYRSRFILSEFNGQLPAPYDSAYNATRLIHHHFNDMNKGDNSTYLKPEDCHYLVDSDTGQPSPLQPAYHQDASAWKIVSSVPLLDVGKSHKIFRAFYVPFLSSKHSVYAHLYLLKNKLIDS